MSRSDNFVNNAESASPAARQAPTARSSASWPTSRPIEACPQLLGLIRRF